jgi:hypothetical protein
MSQLRTQRLGTRNVGGKISIPTSNSAAFICQEFAARTTWPQGQVNKFTLRRRTFIPTYDKNILGTGNVKGFDVCPLVAVAAASAVNILATLRVEDLPIFVFFRECLGQIFYFHPCQ